MFDRVLCDVPCFGDGTLRKDFKVREDDHESTPLEDSLKKNLEKNAFGQSRIELGFGLGWALNARVFRDQVFYVDPLRCTI